MGKFGRLFGSIRAFKNWPAHYLDRYGMGLWSIDELLTRDGLRIAVRPRTADLRTSKSVFVENLYWPAGFELALDATVVDVGAHIGTFTLQAAARVPDGRVIAYEPEPENYRYLEHNVRANNFKRVQTFRSAVAAKEGMRRLYLKEGRATGGHSMFAPGGPSIVVPCTTLLGIIQKHGTIDYLKLDCEGAENEILLETDEGVFSYIRRIAMEQHDFTGRQREAVVKRLTKLGYEVVAGARRGYLFATRVI